MGIGSAGGEELHEDKSVWDWKVALATRHVTARHAQPEPQLSAWWQQLNEVSIEELLSAGFKDKIDGDQKV